MLQHAPKVRYDSNRVWTEDELHLHVPSVFATEAHESRSTKFQPVPTIEVIRSLKTEGFEVVGAKQAVSRIPGKSDFTKHVLRLRQMNNIQAYRVGDTVAEVLLRNANDGTARYNLLAELFRIACLNGMAVALKLIDEVKVGHIGKNVQQDVIEGTFTVIKQAQHALAAPREWSGIRLDRDEQMAFAETAHQLRFADSEGNVTTPITPAQLLIPRRTEDRNNDLWTVTNVIQEHVIRGGDINYGLDANSRMRRVTSRAVNNIDGDIKLNKALFMLADKMATFKGMPSIAA